MSSPRSAPPSRRLRRARRRLVAAAAVVVAVTVAAVSIFVFPRLDEPTQVDAIVVLGRPVPDRIDVAEDLMSQQQNATLVVSVDDYGIDDATNVAPCRQPRPYPVICAVPDPFTTQGEARMLAALADQHEWSSMIVVTSTYHATRARLLFERCIDGEVLIVSDGAQLSVLEGIRQPLYQTAALIKALVTPGC